MSKRKQNLSNSPRKRRNLGKKDKVDDQLKLDIPGKTKPNENEFGNDWINMSLNLISSKGVDKSFKEIFISCQLLYENGDVTNNIQYHTNPNPIKLTKGQCNFKIKIDTLSMYNDNRSYKIVFSVSNNIGRHVEDYTTKAFKLVKHRLEISEQPDEKFYKDEGGRSHCLSTKIVLKDSQSNVVTNRTIPLQCKLVYEDLTPAQSQREILAILSQNLDIKNGHCVINFRINEVSKNHNKRAFRILMECAKKQNTSFHDISSCITNPIMVYSKRTKPTSKKKKHNRRHSKRKKKRYSDDDFDDDYDDISNDDFDLDNNDNNGNHIRIKRNVFRSGLPSNPPESELLNNNPPIKMENNTEINTDGGLLGTMFEWCKLADWIMKKLEWTKCGYEFDEGTNAIDMNRPLYRCPYCLRYRNKAGNGKHENNCQLRIAMNEYNSKVKVMGMEWKYHTNNEPNMNGMGSLESAKSSPLNKENHNNHDNNSMHMNGNNNRHAHTHHNIIIRPPPMQMWPYPPFEHHIPPKHINAPTLPALNTHPNNNNNHHNNGNHINNNMNNNINNNNNNNMHNPVNNNINHNMHNNINNNIPNNVNNSMNLNNNNNNNNNNSEIKQETSRLPTQLSRVRSIKRGISSSKYGNPCYDENGDFFGSFNPHNNTFFNKDQLNTFEDWKLDEMGIPNSMPQQSSEFITRHDTWDDNTFYQYIHDDYMTHIN